MENWHVVLTRNYTPSIAHLSIKEGSLFCFVLHQANEVVQFVFLVSLESSWWGQVHCAWFHDIWTWDAKVHEYWMTSSLKIKLSHSWKFWRNWNVLLVFVERSWWARFNEILFGKIWIQNVRDIDFEVISAAENSNKFQKTRFWKEKSVEKVVKLGPKAEAIPRLSWTYENMTV